MELLSKKPLCPICGSKISWLLPSMIEEEYICSSCYSKIDMDDELANHLTLEGFRKYLSFYEQNQLLKHRFTLTDEIAFGIWDTKMLFDLSNKLFYRSKNQSKTLFEGSQLLSFAITEDNELLFEGSEKGIKRYVSAVPQRVLALEPEVNRFLMSKQQARTIGKLDDSKENGSASVPYFAVFEPFSEFKIELQFDHPYWSVIRCNRKGPEFSASQPNINDYLHLYCQGVAIMEELVEALKVVAFPNAPELSVNLGAASQHLLTPSSSG